MTKWVNLLLAVLSVSLVSAQGLDFDAVGDVDTIMEDNSLTEISNRYSAIQFSFFPEYATRLGFESANNRLDSRTPERDAQALRALRIIQENFNQLDRKKLSDPKKTEYDMLQARIKLDIQRLNQNPLNTDPLLYTEVFDTIQDLRMKNLTYPDLQKRDLTERFHNLPSTAEQAQKNLISSPAFIAQIAMEKAYYAYLTINEIADYLLSLAQDEVSRSQIRADAKDVQKAIKEMFELFKRMAQENAEKDFRLGDKQYTFILQNRYFIDQKPKVMSKFLTKNFKTAQQQLAKALATFDLPTAKSVTKEIVIENIQVPDGEAEEAVTVSTIDQPEQIPTTTQEPAQPEEQPITLGAKFYAISKLLHNQVQNYNFIAAMADEAKQLSQSLVQNKVLPPSNGTFKVRELPTYYAYFTPYLFMPPFGMQTNPSYDFFIRLPHGNELTKQEMLNRDFNPPTLKLVLTGQLVPGLAYRASYSEYTISAFRKMYTVPTLRNGWEVYAQHLANERGYIITDDEQLLLAWADFLRAAQAFVDYNLHSQEMSYSEALNWLVNTNGIEKSTAEAMLKQVAAQPGEAVSYIYGYEALKNLRAKYQKKFGKKFSLADFHTKLMGLGNIPPDRLEVEMENAYAREKTHLTYLLTTPFYVN